MNAVIDRSIFEAFIDGGAQGATVSFYPTEPLTELAITAANILDGMTINVGVYAINSAWARYENEQGTVLGNVTEAGNLTKKARRDMIYEAHF